MATRKRTEVTLTDQERVIAAAEAAKLKANGWVAGGDIDHQNLYARWERGLARRLYEVWRTAGQLGGERWEWSNQSTKQQEAWLAVARAISGPAMQEQFGVAEIAGLMHA